MSVIERIKNWKTTMLGLIVLALAVWRYVCQSIDTGAFISLMLLAYTFILAKNTLLEGITMGYYKIRDASKPPAPQRPRDEQPPVRRCDLVDNNEEGA